MTEVLLTDTPETFAAAARKAADLLKAGEVVALPTETVYGLAANAFDERAVKRIFEIKGRPGTNPIIVHVASKQGALDCTADWPESARALAASFWPGPLTVVLPKSGKVPGIVTAGGSTVGVRWPGHPFMQEVIKLCGFPLAAPSANLSNQISPTTAEHVLKFLKGKVALVVDAGASNVGIESTVVDLSGKRPAILRPGIISQDSIEAALGVALGGRDSEGVLKSPGMLPRHYSPQSKMVVGAWRNADELGEILARQEVAPEETAVICHTHIPSHPGLLLVSIVPHDAPAYARALYAEFHRSDELKPKLILCEAVPELPEWEGIRDRLIRASGQPKSD